MARPLEYNEDMITKARAYIATCNDTVDEGGRITVSLPNKGGLAIALDVNRSTLYDWAKKYPEFSDIMDEVGAHQENRLINNSISGKYNSTIAKVLLTKHGYREGIDSTTNEKDLPTPILHVQRDTSDNKDIQAQ
jgi:hypothetical protein